MANQFFAGVGGVKVIKKPNNKKSFALITALGLCILFGAIITGVFMSSVREISSTKRQIGTTQALWLAESAAREKIQEIKTYFDIGEFPKHFPVDPDKDIGKEYEWGFMPDDQDGSHEDPSGHEPDSGGGSQPKGLPPASGGASQPKGLPPASGGASQPKSASSQKAKIEKIVDALDIPVIATSAQLISVNLYGSGTGDPPIPGDYIYLLTASATVPILGGSTSKTVQCSVKYSYVAPMNIEVGDATIGEDGRIKMGVDNIIYYKDLDLPAGRYDLSYVAKYNQHIGRSLREAEKVSPFQEENFYIRLGKSEILLQEWVDDGDGFDEAGELPCVAGDDMSCYGEYNIPWDLQTGFAENFTHIADNGVNEDLQYHFEVDDDPLVESFLGLYDILDPSRLEFYQDDCDLEEDSLCSKMCEQLDDDCEGSGCGGPCYKGCVEIFQKEHPNSECHRRCDPVHCMRWCAFEYETAYIHSQCVELCCGKTACDQDCLLQCAFKQKQAIEGYTECKDFCAIDNPGECVDDCALNFQRDYNGENVRPGIPEAAGFMSECHRLCKNLSSKKTCFSNCDSYFLCDDFRGNLLIRSEVPQYHYALPYLQGSVQFESFDIVPEESGATVRRIQWLTNVN